VIAVSTRASGKGEHIDLVLPIRLRKRWLQEHERRRMARGGD